MYVIRHTHPTLHVGLEEIDEHDEWCPSRFELIQSPPSYSSDVATFVADVEAGRIERGGVPGKYRVFRNDGGNVVVEFFN